MNLIQKFFAFVGSVIRRFFAYIAAVKLELKKCSWPWESDPKVKGFRKFRELWSSTLVVLVAMVFLGAYVAFFDFVMTKIVTSVIRFLS